MKIIVTILYLIVVLLPQFSYSLCKNVDRKIVIGWDEWPPYIYKENQKMKGFDLAIIKRILDLSNCQYTLSNAPWNRLLNQIKTGKVHLMMGASWTKERSHYSYYSKPFRDETVALFIRKDDFQKYTFHSFEELFSTDIRIGYVIGEYLGPQIDDYLKNNNINGKAKFISGNEISLNFKNLLAKRIDAFIADKYTGLFFLKESKKGHTIMQHPFIIFTNKVHFIFTKHYSAQITNEEIDYFNDNLDKFKKYQYEDIYKEFFSNGIKN